MQTNVLPYPELKASIYRPSSVISDSYVKSTFDLLPISLGHPKQYFSAHASSDAPIIGHIGNVTVSRMGNSAEMLADALITDKKAIDEIIAGRIAELSGGYYSLIKDIKGVFEGMEYTKEIEFMHGNHVALVPQGRAGPNCRIGI
jgi:uncharacterized protein